MKVLITGAGGMVGGAVLEHCTSAGDFVVAYDHKGLEISDYGMVVQTLRSEQPDVVINCAAWTDVDGCESDPKRAHATNTLGPENLARGSGEVGAVLVTISTDYVFDGTKEGFYTQRDQPNPESVYGLSKLEGERRAQQANAATIVVRSGFIFGAGGKNFLSTLIDRVRRGEKLRAIGDSYGTPTYAVDLASRLRELAVLNLPGTFHVVNSGAGASYDEFARAALRECGYPEDQVEVVQMSSLNRPAKRPKNSRLKCLLSEKIGLSPLPDWQDSLRSFIVSRSIPSPVAHDQGRSGHEQGWTET